MIVRLVVATHQIDDKHFRIQSPATIKFLYNSLKISTKTTRFKSAFENYAENYRYVFVIQSNNAIFECVWCNHHESASLKSITSQFCLRNRTL